jgi:hypothetical protein
MKTNSSLVVLATHGAKAALGMANRRALPREARRFSPIDRRRGRKFRRVVPF